MAFKDFEDDTKKVVQSNLNQVIDVIQEDISGSATRRKYQTFVTGGIGPGVTSSLYQTIYDQDFTLQTANAVSDMTIGLFHSDDGTTKRENLVTRGTGYSLSTTTGQMLFDAKSTLMMREKVNIYRQYANYLLGDPDAAFILDSDSFPSSKAKTDFNVVTDTTIMDAALFVNVKRLFSRDGIRKETFAMRLYKNAPTWEVDGNGAVVGPSSNWTYAYDVDTGTNTFRDYSHSSLTPSVPYAVATGGGNRQKFNLFGMGATSATSGVQIIADLGASENYKEENAAGDVALIKLASDSSKAVGLLFYQAGIAVLNLGGSSFAPGYTSSTANSGVVDIDVGLGQLSSTSTIATVFEPRDPIFGVIDGMSETNNTTLTVADWVVNPTTQPAGQGKVLIGGPGGENPSFMDNDTSAGTNDPAIAKRDGLKYSSQRPGGATFYPDLLVSASIDDIVDHIGFTRFSSGSLTAMAFQNQTKINSSIYFCRASASEFNTSANPTFLDSSGVPVMIQDATNDKPFTYITTVALADEEKNVVAIAKLNRPIEKNDESEVTIRVRLDF